MDQSSEPSPPHLDPAQQLQRDLYYQAAHILRGALPPPLADTPEEFERRDRVAIGHVASLSPANGDEVAIASQYVAAYAYGMDCLRLMRANPGTPAAAKLGAEARSTLREARGARSLLLRVQHERHRREKDHAACDHDLWSEHIAFDLMADALSHAPAAPPASLPPPEPAAPEAAAPVAATSAEPLQSPPERVRPRDVDDWTEEEKQAERMRIRAEHWVICNTTHAKAIRKLGGLPPDCGFEPPEPDVLDFIINATTNNLRWADEYKTAGE